MSSPFFVNGRGKPLGKIQKTPGSLFEKIGLCCGLPDLQPTDLRRAAEVHIQNSEAMKNKAKVISNHSDEVGRKWYDPTKIVTRAEFVNKVNAIESTKEENKEDNELSDFERDREERMEDLEKIDEKIRMKEASEFLKNEKDNMIARRRKRGPRNKVDLNDRYFLLELVHKEVFQSVHQDFPQGIMIFLQF